MNLRGPAAVILAAFVMLTGCDGDGGSKWDGGNTGAQATETQAPAPAATTPTAVPTGDAPANEPTDPPVETKTITLTKPEVPAASPRHAGYRWTSRGIPRDGLTAGNFADVVIRDGIDKEVWSKWLNSNAGLTELLLTVRVVYAGASYSSRCLPPNTPLVAATPFVFHCAADDPEGKSAGFLWVPAETYYLIWRTPMKPQDQNMIGAIAASALYGYGVIQTIATQKGLPTPANLDAKLIAACYAGIWTRAAYPADELNATTLEGAIKAIRAGVGIKQSESDPTPDLADVKRAYDTGLVNGNVAMCGQFWPGTTWN